MGKTTENLGRAPFLTLRGPGPQPLFVILALAGGLRSSLEEGLPWDRVGPTLGLPPRAGFGGQSGTPVGVTDSKAEVQERPCVHTYTTPFTGLSVLGLVKWDFESCGPHGCLGGRWGSCTDADVLQLSPAKKEGRKRPLQGLRVKARGNC